MSLRRWTGRAFTAFVPLTVAAIMVAGCGSSNKSSSSSSASTSASTTPAASGKIDVPKKVIAYGEPAAVDEVTSRDVRQVQAAAKELGWEVKLTDGQGDIAKMQAGVQAAINAGADAVIIGSTDASVVRPTLQAAKAKGIPTVLIGGGVPVDPLYTVQYPENEKYMAKLLADKMVKDFNGSGTVIALDIKQLDSGIQRQNGRTEVFKGTNMKVVDDKYGDLADPIEGTKKLVSSMLATHPKPDAMWAVYDHMMAPSLEVMKQVGNKTTAVYTWFAGPAKVAQMRQNPQIKAYIEGNLDHTAAIAMDQLAAHFKNNTPLNPNAIKSCPLHYKIVTRADAPAAGQLVWPLDKDLAPFIANWKKGQFGKGADCGDAAGAG
jgi:ABC-type sugar transport system substrate-binding protein